MRNVSAILLAAGESTRMGRQKALLPWDGTTLIQYQLRELTSIEQVREIIVITGHESGRIEATIAGYPRVLCVKNPAYKGGKVSSILAGLGAVDDAAEAIVLLAVDQPRPARVTEALVSAHLASGAAVTVPVRAGRRGHPIIFNRTVFPELLNISEASLGIRAVIKAHEQDLVELPIDDPAIHVDLNTPEDLPRPSL